MSSCDGKARQKAVDLEKVSRAKEKVVGSARILRAIHTHTSQQGNPKRS